MRSEFEEFAKESVRSALLGADETELDDVYVIGLRLVETDDPRAPALAVEYNTHAHRAARTPRVAPQSHAPAPDRPAPGDLVLEQTPATDDASGRARAPPASAPRDDQEACLNPAFWLRREIAVVGRADSRAATLREAWLRSDGLWFDDAGQQAAQAARAPIAAEIAGAFAQMCVRIAHALHDEGFVMAWFGRPIPIVVHDEDCHPLSALLTEQANPGGIASGFVDWARARR